MKRLRFSVLLLFSVAVLGAVAPAQQACDPNIEVLLAGPACIGSQVACMLCGDPGAVVTILVSLAPGSSTFGGLTVPLAGPILPLTVDVIDPNAPVCIASMFTVPNIPAIVGMDFYYMGLSLNPSQIPAVINQSCVGMTTICSAVTGAGCTPGYWKQVQHTVNWPAPYTPNTLFSSVFDDAFPGMTLDDVLGQGGGGLEALGRHTVAALLNAAAPQFDYPMSETEIIDIFNAAFPNNEDFFEDLKDIFDQYNNIGCPL